MVIPICFLLRSTVFLSHQIGDKMGDGEGLDENLPICPSPPSRHYVFFFCFFFSFKTLVFFSYKLLIYFYVIKASK